jgi:hypothetical protein
MLHRLLTTKIENDSDSRTYSKYDTV